MKRPIWAVTRLTILKATLDQLPERDPKLWRLRNQTKQHYHIQHTFNGINSYTHTHNELGLYCQNRHDWRFVSIQGSRCPRCWLKAFMAGRVAKGAEYVAVGIMCSSLSLK